MRWEPDWKVEDNRRKKVEEIEIQIKRLEKWRYLFYAVPFINGALILATAMGFNPPLPFWARLAVIVPGLALFSIWAVRRNIESSRIGKEIDRLKKE